MARGDAGSEISRAEEIVKAGDHLRMILVSMVVTSLRVKRARSWRL